MRSFPPRGPISLLHFSGTAALLLLSADPFIAAAETVTEAAPASSAASAPEARFDVWEYRILGNSVLASASVERAVYPFLGAGKSIAEVEAARESLERTYRDAGYGTVFVDIPEQETDQGIVRLRVTEGRLDRVRITGARYFSNGRIRAALPALSSGAVPNLPAVQSQLAELNRSTADRGVVPVLKAGRAPGTIDLELKVDDRLPLHGNLELNDRYSPNTSELRLNASLSYTNLFQRQHSLTLQYQTAPEERDDVTAYVGAYSFRVPGWQDTTVALYAVDSNTDVATLGALSVIGDGRIYGARAIRVLPESPGFFHNIAFGIDYKDFLEDIRLVDDETLTTPIDYLNWSLAYSAMLSRERGSTAFDLAANFGVRRLANDSGEFEDKRFKGVPQYFYLSGGAEHLQQLPWNLQIFVRAAGQFTSQPLVSNEQIAIGGAGTVRGYPESSALGDYGFNGTLELRSAWLSRPLQLPPGAAYLFAFYDAGVVAIVDPLPSQAARFDLASWGVGLRIGNWHGLDLAFDWAHAFTDSGMVKPGDERTHFSLRFDF
jgi:hemolysin activation/secretion protein